MQQIINDIAKDSLYDWTENIWFRINDITVQIPHTSCCYWSVCLELLSWSHCMCVDCWGLLSCAHCQGFLSWAHYQGLLICAHCRGLPSCAHYQGLSSCAHCQGLPSCAHCQGLQSCAHCQGLLSCAPCQGLPSCAHCQGLQSCAHFQILSCAHWNKKFFLFFSRLSTIKYKQWTWSVKVVNGLENKSLCIFAITKNVKNCIVNPKFWILRGKWSQSGTKNIKRSQKIKYQKKSTTKHTMKILRTKEN